MESCVDPGHLANELYIKWKFFLLTYTRSFARGALMATWVQSIAPRMLGNPVWRTKILLNILLLLGSVWELYVLRGQPDDALNTAGITLLTDGWDILDLSPISLWNASVFARNPSKESTCTSKGMARLQFVWFCKLGLIWAQSCKSEALCKWYLLISHSS